MIQTQDLSGFIYIPCLHIPCIISPYINAVLKKMPLIEINEDIVRAVNTPLLVLFDIACGRGGNGAGEYGGEGWSGEGGEG